jgi:hypothetical protein
MATIEYIRGVVGVGDVSGDERDVCVDAECNWSKATAEDGLGFGGKMATTTVSCICNHKSAHPRQNVVLTTPFRMPTMSTKAHTSVIQHTVMDTVMDI